MKEFEIEVHPQAYDEAMAALAYIAEHAGRRMAEDWYAGLLSAMDSLRDFPKRCAHAREAERFPDAELRQLIHGSYRILFVVTGEAVRILRVRHVKQDEIRDL